MITKWDKRFLGLAQHVAQWSKDPSTQVGAVIVDEDQRVVSLGFNGLPRGVEDTVQRLADRDVKYQMIVHGERNAIIFAQRSLHGCTMYTWPFMSCSVCAAMIIQAGIRRCVAPYSDNSRWTDSFKLTQDMFTEAGIVLNLDRE
jgi:dCMP deaminase